jgi:hypothetical protein
VVSGDVLINCFQYIFYIKPNFDVSLFVKPYNSIPYGRSIYFQNSSLSKKKIEMRFPLYEHSFHFSISSIKVFSELLFLFTKIGEMGRIPL